MTSVAPMLGFKSEYHNSSQFNSEQADVILEGKDELNSLDWSQNKCIWIFWTASMSSNGVVT